MDTSQSNSSAVSSSRTVGDTGRKTKMNSTVWKGEDHAGGQVASVSATGISRSASFPGEVDKPYLDTSVSKNQSVVKDAARQDNDFQPGNTAAPPHGSMNLTKDNVTSTSRDRSFMERLLDRIRGRVVNVSAVNSSLSAGASSVGVRNSTPSVKQEIPSVVEISSANSTGTANSRVWRTELNSTRYDAGRVASTAAVWRSRDSRQNWTGMVEPRPEPNVPYESRPRTGSEERRLEYQSMQNRRLETAHDVREQRRSQFTVCNDNTDI